VLLALIRRRPISRVVLGVVFPRASADTLEGRDGVRRGVVGGKLGIIVVLGVRVGWW